MTWAQEYEIDYAASREGICIPAKWVRAAVDLEPPASGYAWQFGHRRSGVEPDSVHGAHRARSPYDSRLGQSNTTQTAWRARDEMEAIAARIFTTTWAGFGSGVRGTLDTAERKLRFQAVGANAGESPTEPLWPDSHTSRELLRQPAGRNVWVVRRRFERAYECKEHGIQHRPEDMISIPNHPQLIPELSSVLVKRTDTGMEGKDDEATGSRITGFADAFVLAVYPAAPALFSEVPGGVELPNRPRQNLWEGIRQRARYNDRLKRFRPP